MSEHDLTRAKTDRFMLEEARREQQGVMGIELSRIVITEYNDADGLCLIHHALIPRKLLKKIKMVSETWEHMGNRPLIEVHELSED